MTKDRRPIRERLKAYYTGPEIEVWLKSPQPQLEGKVPNEMMMLGRFDPIHELLDRLDDGVFL
jgi:hypothetical protein